MQSNKISKTLLKSNIDIKSLIKLSYLRFNIIIKLLQFKANKYKRMFKTFRVSIE